MKKKMEGKDQLTPWEQYLQKRKEKKKEKRKGKKVNVSLRKETCSLSFISVLLTHICSFVLCRKQRRRSL